MALASVRAQSNQLLATLAPKDRALIGDAASLVDLVAGNVILDRGDRVRHIYFPLDAIVSLLATADEHAMVEVAMVGREGVIGYIEGIAGRVSSARMLVVHSGTALRISVNEFLKCADASATMRETLNNYLFAYIAQLAQTVACTRFHQIEQRLTRWLLMADDRSPSSNLRITQDLLAILLGVRRVGISSAAMSLKAKGLIDYSRGKIQLIDRLELESEACACYRADHVAYSRHPSVRRAHSR